MWKPVVFGAIMVTVTSNVSPGTTVLGKSIALLPVCIDSPDLYLTSIPSEGQFVSLVFCSTQRVVKVVSALKLVPSSGLWLTILHFPSRGWREFVGMIDFGGKVGLGRTNGVITNGVEVNIAVEVGLRVGVGASVGREVGVQVGGRRRGVGVAVGINNEASPPP